jgi:hypothetical protein
LQEFRVRKKPSMMEGGVSPFMLKCRSKVKIMKENVREKAQEAQDRSASMAGPSDMRKKQSVIRHTPAPFPAGPDGAAAHLSTE